MSDVGVTDIGIKSFVLHALLFGTRGRAARRGRWLARRLPFDDGRRGHRGGLVVLALVGAAVYWFGGNGGEGPALSYRTGSASRGDPVGTVVAAGKLKFVGQMDVGSEISGAVKSVLADYNARVTQGQVWRSWTPTSSRARWRNSKSKTSMACPFAPTCGSPTQSRLTSRC